MRAFVLRGEWQPSPGYPITSQEEALGLARVACRVWRNPTASWEEVPDPAPQADEVVVRVRAVGVCGSDVHCVFPDETGYVRFSGPAKLPVILGHEFAGEVVEVGRSVRSLRVGDPVAVEGMRWCGLCEPCRAGWFNQCLHLEMVGFTAPGAYAEYVATSERYCWNLSGLREHYAGPALFEAGALLEPAGCAYLGLFWSHDRFKPGVEVLVVGTGPIGLAAIALARAAGASLVVGVEPAPSRRDLALRLGAHHALDPAREDLVDALGALTSGRGFDLLVEAAGEADSTFPWMEKLLAPRGRLVYLGRTGRPARLDPDLWVSSAGTVAGSRGHAGAAYGALLRMMGARVLDLRPMITHRLPLAQVHEALSTASGQRTGKVMVQAP